MSSHQLDFVQKRRTTRIYNAIPLAIQGSDAFRGPFLEQVSTLTVNCHGCRYRSNHQVIPGDTICLEVKQSSEGSATYACQAKVKWVQRLMTKDSSFEIAVELAAPGNIWESYLHRPIGFQSKCPKLSCRKALGKNNRRQHGK